MEIDAVRSAQKLKVLLVEDNQTHSHLIRRHLNKAGRTTVEISEATTLAEAISILKMAAFDAVLLDLSLPDSEIGETMPRVITVASHVPIVVLTSLDDLEFASDLVHQGADDFLVKSELNGEALLRSIRYAIERKKNRRELAQYAAELRRSNDELKSFAHTVAHEVRSPLNVVACCLTLIEEDHAEQFEPDSRESLIDAKRAIEGMTELVTDLLEFSRVEHSEEPHAAVDMNEVWINVLAQLRSDIEANQAIVGAETLPNVTGNRVQLRQLLTNLVTNAIKYRHPDRPPHVELRSIALPAHWQFSIVDNGLGIAAQDRENVFAPFVRAHESTGIAGTGIGLSFCRRIVENHGGEIKVESAIDHGSTFTFTLKR